MKPSLLDTDTLSEVLKKRNAQVLQHASDYLAQHLRFTISSMTRYEVLRGLKDKNALRRIKDFETFCGHVEILPISDAVLDRAAELWVEARRGGHPRYDADLIIAATALEHGRVLATGNTSHYSWVPGLVIEDLAQSVGLASVFAGTGTCAASSSGATMLPVPDSLSDLLQRRSIEHLFADAELVRGWPAGEERVAGGQRLIREAMRRCTVRQLPQDALSRIYALLDFAMPPEPSDDSHANPAPD